MANQPNITSHNVICNVIVIDHNRGLLWLSSDDGELWGSYPVVCSQEANKIEQIVKSLALNNFAVLRITKIGDSVTIVTHDGDTPNKDVSLSEHVQYIVVASCPSSEEFSTDSDVTWNSFEMDKIESSDILLSDSFIGAIKEAIKKDDN